MTSFPLEVFDIVEGTDISLIYLYFLIGFFKKSKSLIRDQQDKRTKRVKKKKTNSLRKQNQGTLSPANSLQRHLFFINEQQSSQRDSALLS